eukprot:EG_transcript_18102
MARWASPGPLLGLLLLLGWAWPGALQVLVAGGEPCGANHAVRLNPNATQATNLSTGKFVTLDEATVPLYDYVRISSPVYWTTFGVGRSFTVELWVRVTATVATEDPAIISSKNWHEGTWPGWVIALSAGGTGVVANVGDGSLRADIVSSQGIHDGQWHHLAVTWLRGVNMTMYIDGVVVGVAGIAKIGDVRSGVTLTVGNDDTTYYPPFHGLVDSVRVWAVARSAAEIRHTMAASRLTTHSHPDLVTSVPFQALFRENSSSTALLLSTDFGTVGARVTFMRLMSVAGCWVPGPDQLRETCTASATPTLSLSPSFTSTQSWSPTLSLSSLASPTSSLSPTLSWSASHTRTLSP